MKLNEITTQDTIDELEKLYKQLLENKLIDINFLMNFDKTKRALYLKLIEEIQDKQA